MDAAGAAGPRGLGRVKVARAVFAALTLAAVGALGLIAAESGGTVTRHTTVERSAGRAPTPTAPAASTGDAASPAGAPAPPLVQHVPPETSAPTAAPTSVLTPPAPAALSPLPATAPSSTAAAAPVANVLPACPLPLPVPVAQGGLQSLIPFAPLFGPFSAEAFASAPTFQPLLELFGPFLVAFAQHYAAVQPSVTPLLDQLEALENAGYAVLAPLYAPYRSQLLTAESNLATALAPVAASLVGNPASSCVVDLEGMLAAAH